MNHQVRLHTLDLSNTLANLHRSSLGFDRMFNDLMRTTNLSNSGNYPPYNLVKLSEVCYAIQIAVAGFKETELSISVDGNVITITGNKNEEDAVEYMHRGISTKSFERTFNLAEHAVVKGAKYEDGMLTVSVEFEIPEALKPRTIQIEHSRSSK